MKTKHQTMAAFGVFFVGHSFPITSDHFVQVDATHWVSATTAAAAAVTPATACVVLQQQHKIRMLNIA